MVTWRTEAIASEIKANYIFAEAWANEYGLAVQHTPLCLIGPPGIGKTECVRQAAREIALDLGKTIIEWNRFENLNAEERMACIEKTYNHGSGPFFFVEINLSTHDPADFSGHPEKTNEYIPQPDGQLKSHLVTAFSPMKWARYIQNFPGIVFIDEFTNVNRQDLRSISLKVLEGKIGYSSISAGTLVIVAGNNMGESSMALPLSEPTINRIQLINIIPPTALGWLHYIENTYGEAVEYMAAGYLSNLASSSPDPKPSPEYLSHQSHKAFVTPRSCDLLLKKISIFNHAYRRGLLSQADFHSATEGAAVSLIGEKEGALFAAWYKNQHLLEAALQDPARVSTLSPSQICGLSVIMGRKIGSALTQTSYETLASCRHTLEAICSQGKEYAGLMVFAAGIFPAREVTLENLGSFFSRFALLRSYLDEEEITDYEVDLWLTASPPDFLNLLSEKSFLDRSHINLRDSTVRNPFYTREATALSKIFTQSVKYLLQPVLDALIKDMLKDMSQDSAAAIHERITTLQEIRQKL